MSDEAHHNEPDQRGTPVSRTQIGSPRPPRPPHRSLRHEFPSAIWYHTEEIEAVTRVLSPRLAMR